MSPGGTLASAPRLALTYVLPIRLQEPADDRELVDYLSSVAGICDEVIVVDGSPEAAFDANGRRWGAVVTHIRPRRIDGIQMGKVAAVHTALPRARNEAVVIADDDVRYSRGGLERIAELLADHDLVRPQNYFDPLPLRCRWDSARIVLNRALGGDFPGTLAVRRSFFVSIGGYEGDALFENLELIRTIEVCGGRVANAMDLFVRRLPPSRRTFLEQRVRYAYEEFAHPARMAAWLVVVPLVGLLSLLRRTRFLVAISASVSLLAEIGRRRDGGARRLPRSASLLAPAWSLERGFTAWFAVYARIRYKGVRYGDRSIRTSAHSKRRLRSRRPGSPSRR